MCDMETSIYLYIIFHVDFENFRLNVFVSPSLHLAYLIVSLEVKLCVIQKQGSIGIHIFTF